MVPGGRPATRHRTGRIGWLHAAVLGANDGIVSTAAGEYVSVHSQAETEKADLSRERAELEADPAAEHRELTAIYAARGLEPALAEQVAEQPMRHDALGGHAPDELGISEALSARAVQAALASAGSFAFGAVLPLAVTALALAQSLMVWGCRARRSSLWPCWARWLPGPAAQSCWWAYGGSPSGVFGAVA